MNFYIVIPAQSGIALCFCRCLYKSKSKSDSRLRGNDEQKRLRFTPFPIPNFPFPASPTMETKANYVLIGAFTLATGIALLLFGLWAAKYSSERTWQEYRVVFDEPVSGLSPGSPVQYNGITVGSITKLSLAPNDPRQAIARIRLDAQTPVKTDTRAKLAITSLTGPIIIQLTGGSPQARLLTDVDHSSVPTILTSPSALQSITDTANRIIDRLDTVFSDQNVASIGKTLQNLDQISTTIAAQKADLQALMVNARQAMQQLNTTLATTQGTMQHLDQNLVQQLPPLMNKLDATLTKLDSAADNADAMLGENRAAISNFTNDDLAQLGPTLAELRALVRDLRRVSDRLEGNPARYLLGRDAPKEFKP
jgi:phospholipid/cholesterol/gamma-HCH transport system substrate-binding protein